MNRAAWLQDRRMKKFRDVLSRWEAGCRRPASCWGCRSGSSRRYRGRFEEDAAEGLVDRRFGKPSPKRVPAGRPADAGAVWGCVVKQGPADAASRDRDAANAWDPGRLPARPKCALRHAGRAGGHRVRGRRSGPSRLDPGCIEEERVGARDNALAYDSRRLQLPATRAPATSRLASRCTNIPTDSLAVFHGPRRRRRLPPCRARNSQRSRPPQT